MERITVLKHKSATILKVDVSRSPNLEEHFATLARAKAIIASKPPKSMLLLTDVTGTPFNVRAVDEIKAYTTHNTPFVKASAVVGITGLTRFILEVVVKLTGRTIASFDAEDEALDWLAGQSGETPPLA